TVTSGSPTYVSQSTLTSDPALGGKAACTFNVAVAGNYVIDMVVDAATLGSNSLFVNVDAEPTAPTMIWDVTSLTSGFQTRTVSWRGTGTESAPQYSPKVFSLSAGSHQLILRGREAGMKVDKITIRPQ
ncbi:MAG TPA: hypothetical protein VFN74_01405, partial [Chloroflexota bacterium]|nr:hypothetical protein [Chloroflexota bacterium]